MGDKTTTGADQGVHYHYHFYGYGAPGAEPAYAPPAAGGPAAEMGQPVPPPFPQPPFGPRFGAQPGPGATAAPGTNAHQHPSADSLVKGLLVGAGAAYLLTNETAQRAIMRTAVQVWAVLQNSVEELKERLHDAEAEVVAEAAAAAETADKK